MQATVCSRRLDFQSWGARDPEPPSAAATRIGVTQSQSHPWASPSCSWWAAVWGLAGESTSPQAGSSRMVHPSGFSQPKHHLYGNGLCTLLILPPWCQESRTGQCRAPACSNAFHICVVYEHQCRLCEVRAGNKICKQLRTQSPGPQGPFRAWGTEEDSAFIPGGNAPKLFMLLMLMKTSERSHRGGGLDRIKARGLRDCTRYTV